MLNYLQRLFVFSVSVKKFYSKSISFYHLLFFKTQNYIFSCFLIFMWYWAFLLPFPISQSFGHDYVAWVKTTSWPYLVSLCLGQHPGLSFYSVSHCGKDKCHYHCTLPEQQRDPSPVQASVQGACSFLSQGCSGAEQWHALQVQLLVRTCRLVRHKSGC